MIGYSKVSELENEFNIRYNEWGKSLEIPETCIWDIEIIDCLLDLGWKLVKDYQYSGDGLVFQFFPKEDSMNMWELIYNIEDSLQFVIEFWRHEGSSDVRFKGNIESTISLRVLIQQLGIC